VEHYSHYYLNKNAMEEILDENEIINEITKVQRHTEM